MELKALYLNNFRNYKDTVVHFSPKINIILGENAQGKTNLLEAIFVLMTGRSFRTHHLSDLIAFGASDFYLEAHFIKDGVDQTLKMHCDGVQRKIIHNSTPLTSLSSLLGIFVGVILSPEDHELIKGQPGTRRHFLDLQIAQTSPLYIHYLLRYQKAMKQRNYLLKQQSLEAIEIWEHQMAEAAGHITLARQSAVKELQLQGHHLQNILSGEKDFLNLCYLSPALHAKCEALEEIQSYYFGQYTKLRKRESLLGYTLSGPHKDDFSILLAEKEMRYFGSEGQQRSSVAALRLAEWNRLKSLTEIPPLLCIDDVGISLDPYREQHLYSHLGSLGQVFLTSPRLERPLTTNDRCFQVSQGTVTTC